MKNKIFFDKNDHAFALEILAKANEIYKSLAINNSHFNKYIIDHRYTKSTIELYGLGLASDKNSILDDILSSSCEADSIRRLNIAIKIGLLRIERNSLGKLSDTFLNRIMVPLWNNQGEVIAFTSKTIYENTNARFMNSIDSIVFIKNNLLYGYHLAVEDIKMNDFVILTSGSLNHATLRQNNIKNVVSLMGSALSDQAIDQLLSLTKNIILSCDDLFNRRIGNQLLEKKANVRILSLDSHKGPAGYIWSNGLIDLLRKIEDAKQFR